MHEGIESSQARPRYRQRAVRASDSEWTRIGRAAAAAGMDKSRYVIHRALGAEPVPAMVAGWCLRQTLVLALIEERERRAAGLGEAWDDACATVDAWLEREGTLAALTDPGAANRWKTAARPDDDVDAPS